MALTKTMAMKKIKLIVIVLLLSVVTTTGVKGQTIVDAIQQLALDYQKLAGMKSVLQQMYKGYEVVSNGYNSVKNISKGNFDLHDAFLNGLMLVSPTVRKYPRVKDIISDQETIVAEYKAAAGTFKKDKHITPDEIGNIMDVYNNIVSKSLENLTELSMVMADNKLRMGDDERLQLIDQIYSSGHDQLTFLRHFNNQTRQVAIARAAQANDRQTIKKLYQVQ
jgi:hypothetical protein